MALPAEWKLKREVKRIGMKVHDLPLRLLGRRLQDAYDRDKTLVRTPGAHPRTADLAVLLIYPTEGVPASIFATLDHLRAHGIAPAVVSNAPLSAAERTALADHAHLVIERPNRGYDFGGYRDGVLDLIETGPAPRSLFVLNDSVWFPVGPDCTLLEDARAHPADLFGIYYNRRDRTPHRSHLQSYFFRFGSGICASPHLEAFWRGLITYDSKDLTVRRNEMTLTHWFASHGFSIGHLYTIEDLNRAVLDLAPPDRMALADYLIRIGDRYAAHLGRRRGEGAYDDDAVWRADVEVGVLGRYLLSSHPTVLLERMGCPVLKKDMQPMYRTQRAIAAAPRYAARLSPTVRREIAARI